MMGFINIVKTVAQSVGPFITGSLARADMFWLTFVLAGVLQACYDVGMLVTFAGRDDSKPASKEGRDDDDDNDDDH